MTHDTEIVKKTVEFKEHFLSLNDKGQDSALNILRALEFAQSVMCEPVDTNPRQNTCLHN